MSSGSSYGPLKNEVFIHVAICVGFVILLVLVLLFGWYAYKKKGALSTVRDRDVSSEIKDIGVDQSSANHNDHKECIFDVPENFSGEDAKGDNLPNENASLVVNKMIVSSPTAGLPEFSHAGWGHWFTLRDLEIATNNFSKENVIGEGGYGVVYQGQLINGAPVAVKKILNNLGQVEKEFRVEVEAIGHVRHKNLVRLIGYCIEGTHRLLVYEYVGNGNLEQWLHSRMSTGYLTWEGRMKIILGTANALAYLHEAIDPKVVHRDVKSSNILIDDDFNAKLSDFGLAKLLSAGKSHIITRVMGTYGYVAPEYASSGFLNEKCDVYSFGVVFLETITGRQPVDDSLPVHEKNIVDWMKIMVGANRAEEVIDPFLEVRPSTSAFKRALLIAMRCVDSNVEKRPAMSKVVRMLECEDPLAREERRRLRE